MERSQNPSLNSVSLHKGTAHIRIDSDSIIKYPWSFNVRLDLEEAPQWARDAQMSGTRCSLFFLGDAKGHFVWAVHPTGIPAQMVLMQLCQLETDAVIPLALDRGTTKMRHTKAGTEIVYLRYPATVARTWLPLCPPGIDPEAWIEMIVRNTRTQHRPGAYYALESIQTTFTYYRLF